MSTAITDYRNLEVFYAHKFRRCLAAVMLLVFLMSCQTGMDSSLARVRLEASMGDIVIEVDTGAVSITALGTHGQFSWITEIAPDQFAAAIQHGMDISLAGLKEVLHEA